MAVRYLTPPTPGRAHYASAVGSVARMLEVPPMPWQEHVNRITTETLDDGSWAYTRVIITVPRQAGKTTTRGPLALHRCLTRRMARCWLTAQTRGDARDIIVDELGARFTRTPLNDKRRIGYLVQSQGREGLYFPNSTGSAYRVFSPGEDALHGKANELVDVDEMWRFSALEGAALEQAIFPTFTTTGGQFIGVSTAGTSASEWLWSWVVAGRHAVETGRDSGLALVEYGLPDDLVPVVRDQLSDGPGSTGFDTAVQTLAEHNPAYGYTIKVPAIAAGVEAMLKDPAAGGVDGALRAYGNVWTRTAVTLIPSAVITDTEEAATPPPSAAVGIAAGIDRADTAVVAAWRDHTGRPYFATLEHTPGTVDGPERIAAHRRRPELMACVAAGPVLEVVDAAERRHKPLTVTRVPLRDYGAACAQLLTLLLERIARHDGAPAFVDATQVAAKRNLGDGAWVWARTQSAGSVAALEAATVALWQYDHAPAPAPAPAVH